MWAYTKACSIHFETMMIKVISKDKLCERKILLFMLLNLNCNLLFIIYFFRINIPSSSPSISMNEWRKKQKKGIKRSMLHKLSFNFYSCFFLIFYFYDKFSQSPTLFYCCFLLLNGQNEIENKRKHKTFLKVTKAYRKI